MIFTEDECPLCPDVKMRINEDDLFECPDCHMQLATVPMLYAIVLRERGQGRFRPSPHDEGNMSDLALTKAVGDGVEPDESGFFASITDVREYLAHEKE